MQIESGAAQERSPICFGRRSYPFFFKPRTNERVDRVTCSLYYGNGLWRWFLERPPGRRRRDSWPFRPESSAVDPFAQSLDIFLGESRSRRHGGSYRVSDGEPEAAFFCFARNDRRTARTALQDRRTRGQVQSGCGCLGPMTRGTALLQDCSCAVGNVRRDKRKRHAQSDECTLSHISRIKYTP